MGLQHDSTTTLTNYSTLLVLTVDMGVQGRERPTGVRAPIDTTLNTKPWGRYHEPNGGGLDLMLMWAIQRSTSDTLTTSLPCAIMGLRFKGSKVIGTREIARPYPISGGIIF